MSGTTEHGTTEHGTAAVPFFTGAASLRRDWDSLEARLRTVADSGRFTFGPLGRELEQAIAALTGAKHAVAVGNGTDALIILLREIAVSGLREFLAQLSVSIPVSRLAKWKTTFQMVSLGALILAGALPNWPWVHEVGLGFLWLAAVLTLLTGWDYLRVGLRHMD